ncbi:MAG: superoxide dismutase, Cu-Zn family [Acetobacteraceae bacterium]|jgi:Cu-Zn family superoxide dismutase|nr:superoxide dismutase, Cu-Zn family [Acetobacteraceae bacterium]
MRHPIGATLCLAMLATAIAFPALAADLTVTMHKATQEGTSDALGTVTITSTDAGAVFKLDLHGLPPGQHGFHVHENANCDPTLLNGVRIPAGAAGGHFDPDHANKHAGPMGEGHLGDLPVLIVATDGTAKQTLTAPRIKNIDALKDHALIIHIGGDNYSDQPNLLGGGGGRFACGLVE